MVRSNNSVIFQQKAAKYEENMANAALVMKIGMFREEELNTRPVKYKDNLITLNFAYTCISTSQILKRRS